MDSFEASNNKKEDTSSSSQHSPEPSYTSYLNCLSPISDITGGEGLIEDPCKIKKLTLLSEEPNRLHQEKPSSYVNEPGKIQDVECPSLESLLDVQEKENYSAIMDAENLCGDGFMADKDLHDLGCCIQNVETASNSLPTHIPEEYYVPLDPSSVTSSKPRSGVLHLNSLIKATPLSTTTGSAEDSKKLHKLVISPYKFGIPTVSVERVSTVKERHGIDASEAADFVTSESPSLVQPIERLLDVQENENSSEIMDAKSLCGDGFVANQDLYDLGCCIQNVEAASNSLGRIIYPPSSHIPQEPISSPPSCVTNSKPRRSGMLHLNSLLKASPPYATTGSAEGSKSARTKLHKLIISTYKPRVPTVSVSTIEESSGVDELEAADFVTSESPNFTSSSYHPETAIFRHDNKKTSPTDHATRNSQKFKQPGPNTNMGDDDSSWDWRRSLGGHSITLFGGGLHQLRSPMPFAPVNTILKETTNLQGVHESSSPILKSVPPSTPSTVESKAKGNNGDHPHEEEDSGEEAMEPKKKLRF